MANRKPRCKSKGCRKSAGEGSVFCQMHEERAHPEDAVMKCSREEALRFQALDSEYRRLIGAVQFLELEGENARMRYEADAKRRADSKTAAMQEAATHQREYEALVRQIAEKNNLDPKMMTIDPETCVLRDLRVAKTD